MGFGLNNIPKWVIINRSVDDYQLLIGLLSIATDLSIKNFKVIMKLDCCRIENFENAP